MADKTHEKEEKQRQKEKERFEREREQWKKANAQKRQKKAKLDATELAIKAIAIAIAAALVLGVAWIYGSNYQIPLRFAPALKVGSQTVYAPEYAFYFYNQYSPVAQQAAAYAQYGMSGMMGVDMEKSIFGQMKPKDNDADKEVTWDQYFRDQTDDNLHSMLAVYAQAKKDGAQMTELQTKIIEDAITQLHESAKEYAMSVNAFLRLNHTPGLTEKKYRAIMEREQLVQGYERDKQKEFKDKYTDAVLRQEYQKNSATYDFVDYRVYAFAKEQLTATKDDAGKEESAESLKARQAEADAPVKAEAEAFLAKAITEAGFISAAEALHTDDDTYSASHETLITRGRLAALTTTYNETAAKWLLAADEGDTTLIETDSSFYVFYALKPAYQINTVDYYVIPVQAESGAADEETKAKADGILETFLASDRSLASFQKLASENVGDEIKAANPYETPGHVPSAVIGTDEETAAMDDWAFHSARKPADTTVIQVSQGYAVMYFVGVNKDEYTWKPELLSTRVSTDYAAFLEQLRKDNPMKEFKLGMKATMVVAKKMCDQMLSYLQQQLATASSANFADMLGGLVGGAES